MSSIMEISEMFPGFRFSPTDQELIYHYLKRKIDGLENSGDMIAEVDICKFEPWDLPGKSVIPSDHEWFFFSPSGKKYPNGSQAKRATEVGFWKATGKERSIKSRSSVIGTKRTLVFHVGRAPKGERTDWIMHEYCLKGNKDSFVICRLRKKPDFTSKADSPSREAASHDSPFNSGSQAGGDMLQLQRGVHGKGRGGPSHRVDDCFSDILNDDIINLDEILLPGSPLPLPLEEKCERSKLSSEAGPSSTFISHVHSLQGTANRRIRLETTLSRVKVENVLGDDNEGSVAKVMERDDRDCNRLIKGRKINKSLSCIGNGWKMLTLLILTIVALLAFIWLVL